MRRLALLLSALALLLCALPACGQACSFQPSIRIIGPEAHDNLWQFATWNRVWRATGSDLLKGVPRLTYQEGYFYLGLGSLEAVSWGGTCPAVGERMVCASAYTSSPNLTAQRAYYAITSVLVSASGLTTGDATMREVPPATATQDAGTVTVSWSAVPAQTEVIGYQVVRSADGIASWVNVGTVTTLTSATDAPGTGTWYYAVEVAYLGTPTQQVSPHGLAASVVVP